MGRSGDGFLFLILYKSLGPILHVHRWNYTSGKRRGEGRSFISYRFLSSTIYTNVQKSCEECAPYQRGSEIDNGVILQAYIQPP